MIFHFCPEINKPHSCPFTPNSRDCYFKITLQACPKQSHFVCQGSHRTMLCPVYTTIHTGRPQEAHGYRTPLMRDPDKAASRSHEGSDRLSMEQQLDFQGAWPLLCTHL